MNTSNPSAPNRLNYGSIPSVPAPRVREDEVNDFAEVNQQQQNMVYRTIPGFMKMVSRDWSFEDIEKFGRKVKSLADSVDMQYTAVFDRTAGVMRTYPLPFLERVYRVMAPKFNWPEIVDTTPALGSGPQELEARLKADRRTGEHLRTSFDIATDPEVKRSIGNVMVWLDLQIQQGEAELAGQRAAAE